MKFNSNIHKFSPVANGNDLPFSNDLFFKDSTEIPNNEKQFNIYLKKNNIEIDTEWWFKQQKRCLEGYIVEDCLEKGGDAIIDGRDAIWNDTSKKIEYYNENFDFPVIIPPETVYLTDADLMCPKGDLKITNRHYFYLNFYKILRDIPGKSYKDLLYPDFMDLDLLKAYRIELQLRFGKDNMETKSRQTGFSKGLSGLILAYNQMFVRSSQNIIVAGNDDDASELFLTATEGIERMKNTQFYKFNKTNRVTDLTYESKYFNSRILGFTAGSKNAQVLSRLVPYWVIYEEGGKWAKSLLEKVIMFVEPSIVTKGKRYGHQTIIATGGDMELGADDVEKIHYSNNNNFLKFKNKFESVPVEGKSSWFTSKAWFSVVDDNGNSNVAEGMKYVQSVIDAETDPVKKYIKITQWAKYASDAFMLSSSGYFGERKIKLLNDRLREIRLHKELQIERYGILEWIDINKPFNGVRFIDTSEDDAFICITEEAMVNEKGMSYIDLYEIGIDSYDMDESNTSTSKGAAVVRKKFLDNDTTSNVDVALIFERPKEENGGAAKFYEHCAMASIYYGLAMMTIEHTKVRIIHDLVNNGFESLIALRPTMAFSNMVNKSNASNKYGVDGSMKPHVMAALSESLTDLFISNMFLTKQIRALARYKYSRTYNCDITVATAHANIGAKENEHSVAKTRADINENKELHLYYTTDLRGNVIQVLK